MKTTPANIYLVLQQTSAGKAKISWQEIVGAVKESGMVIKNWMSVRNILQSFINHGKFVRTSDLTVEEYQVH